MKKLILIFLITGLYACEKKDNRNCQGGNDRDDFGSEATILGEDMRMCICHCGGYYIKIDQETFRVIDLPPNDLNLSHDKFPMKVQVDWEAIQPTEQCNAKDLIKVLRIEKED